MNYGRAIRIIRTARGLSQKDLARRAKIDASYVSILERGTRAPTTRTLEALAEALHAPLYLLLLIASDEPDLKGISTEEAAKLGKQLLELLMNVEAEAKK